MGSGNIMTILRKQGQEGFTKLVVSDNSFVRKEYREDTRYKRDVAIYSVASYVREHRMRNKLSDANILKPITWAI